MNEKEMTAILLFILSDCMCVLLTHLKKVSACSLKRGVGNAAVEKEIVMRKRNSF